jgi:hypothetical protein
MVARQPGRTQAVRGTHLDAYPRARETPPRAAEHRRVVASTPRPEVMHSRRSWRVQHKFERRGDPYCTARLLLALGRSAPLRGRHSATDIDKAPGCRPCRPGMTRGGCRPPERAELRTRPSRDDPLGSSRRGRRACPIGVAAAESKKQAPDQVRPQTNIALQYFRLWKLCSLVCPLDEFARVAGSKQTA